MANAAGMLKESIWRDKAFRALPRAAQATYAQLLSQKELDRAGMQPLQVAKWAKGCDACTAEDIMADLKVLQDRRFVFFDEDTDELFIRSYMRHCDITRYPNILKNAMRCATLVASEAIRHELATELRRLRRAEAARVADQIDPEPHNGSETHSNPSETVPEGLNGSETLTEPQGYGTGSGTVTLGSSQVGEQPPPSRFCENHPNGTAESCGPCGTARRAFGDWERRAAADAESAKQARRQAVKAAIAACPDCDPNGLRYSDPEDPESPLIRCTHPRLENTA